MLSAQYPTVTLRHSLPRPHRLALALALLAVLAQLWMAQLSTRHLGQMLWQQTLWGDICTVHNSPLTALDISDASDPADSSNALSRMANCPVCSVATAATLAPGSQPTAALAAPADTPYQPAPASAPLRALRHAGLRPPAQAPPAA